MAGVKVRFNVRDNSRLKAYLKKVPRGTLRDALVAFVEYIIGDGRHGLSHPDPYRYVKRVAAYGVSFFSAAQRGYVMAMIKKGQITPGVPNRSGESEESWSYTQPDPYKAYITNPTRGAYYTRDDYGQAAQPAMVGWRTVSKIISDNFTGAIRAANAAVKKWLQENRP